jgi:hypothetical protein
VPRLAHRRVILFFWPIRAVVSRVLIFLSKGERLNHLFDELRRRLAMLWLLAGGRCGID